MSKIEYINARQIFDSRGNPTVEADVFLADGAMGRASVPSGASTGAREAHELRDGGKDYGGNGVLKAVENITTEIFEGIVGMNAYNQFKIDEKLIKIDGTKNKERLGANAILAVSLATAKATANSKQEFLFEYINSLSRIERIPLLPMPMCNIINGGKHALNSTDIQEFMIIPVGANNFTEVMKITTEVFHSLRDVLVEKGYRTTVGDEGGFAPSVKSGNREPFELITLAIEKAGYDPGKDITFAIDVASSELFIGGEYELKSENKKLTAHELIEFYSSLIKDFPLTSIEDGISENDWDEWKVMEEALGSDVQLVGDDLLVTNVEYLKRAIEEKVANAILIKPNQIGTLSETIEAVDVAHESGWNAIVSHRSGETEDTTIAHLSVGLATGQIKTGSLSRTDRVSKYNELLRIEELLESAIER